MIYIVVDLSFGDSGKGVMVDYLASKLSRANGNDRVNPLVVRFNGGHQAGHTVCMADGRRHVFSNFGSGTFRGAPTYWSNYCTIDPLAIIKEHKALVDLKTDPVLYIDALCPVTTFYDIRDNQAEEEKRGNRRHGSCGVGFGATVKRNETPYKLYAQDLKYPDIVRLKLKAIHSYYFDKVGLSLISGHLRVEVEKFMDSLKEFNKIVKIVNEKDILSTHKKHGIDFIFEGAQGILLDQDFGFFPHVTRSNTTSKNAIALIEKYDLLSQRSTPSIYYITRAYQTRHGAGPMTNEEYPLQIKENPLETNKTGPWQEHFRKAPLDLDLLRYAMDCDSNFSVGCDKNLLITCMDQVEGDIMCSENGVIKGINKEMIHEHILPTAYKFFQGNSPVSGDITVWRNNAAKSPINW